MPELKKKISEILCRPRLANIATVTEDGKPWTRYVMAIANEDFVIRIATSLESRKTAQIKANPEVHLTTGVDSLDTAKHYVQVVGRAEIKSDESLRKAMWNEALKTYFSGPNDPLYVIIEIRPRRIEYMTMDSMQPEIWKP